MKFMGMILSLTLALPAFAAPKIGDGPCEREILAGALKAAIDSTPGSVLLTDSFSITDYKDGATVGLDFDITIEDKAPAPDNSVVTKVISVHLEDFKSCKVTASLKAG